MALNETFTLSNGVTIPKLGLGTWCIEDEKAMRAVHLGCLKRGQTSSDRRFQLRADGFGQPSASLLGAPMVNQIPAHVSNTPFDLTNTPGIRESLWKPTRRGARGTAEK